MFQLWTVSKLGKLPWSIRKDVRFYAPLTESLDFYGIDPVTFTRGIVSTRVGRDGLTHNIGADTPQFNFLGDFPQGLWWMSGQVLQYAAANTLNDGNTLIWFEDSNPRSTPTNPNVFDASGSFGGPVNHSYKEIFKANRLLSNAEINEIQFALADVVQVFPPPIEPPETNIGVFIKETPSGIRNGSNTVFSLSQTPEVASVLVVAHGVTLEQVASSPGNMQYTLSGVGSKTLTLGMAPVAATIFFVQYVTG